MPEPSHIHVFQNSKKQKNQLNNIPSIISIPPTNQFNSTKKIDSKENQIILPIIQQDKLLSKRWNNSGSTLKTRNLLIKEEMKNKES